MKEPHTETGEGRRAVCVSCSNMTGSQENSISIKLCEILAKQLSGHNIESHIVDLRKYELFPCVGCGECYESRRCCCDPRFNEIYDSFTRADYLFFVSPHYAPIPSKLAVLLEKMEQITFLHWWKVTIINRSCTVFRQELFLMEERVNGRCLLIKKW